MTRSQRRQHVVTWFVLGPLIALGLLAALIARPRVVMLGASHSANETALPTQPAQVAREHRP